MTQWRQHKTLRPPSRTRGTGAGMVTGKRPLIQITVLHLRCKKFRSRFGTRTAARKSASISAALAAAPRSQSARGIRTAAARRGPARPDQPSRCDTFPKLPRHSPWLLRQRGNAACSTNPMGARNDARHLSNHSGLQDKRAVERCGPSHCTRCAAAARPRVERHHRGRGRRAER